NDIDASIVMGITRDSVLSIARDLGIPISVRPVSTSDVALAEELFFSGTAVEIMPITEVDGRTVGDGRPGMVTKRIQQTFFDRVYGRSARYMEWLACASHGASSGAKEAVASV